MKAIPATPSHYSVCSRKPFKPRVPAPHAGPEGVDDSGGQPAAAALEPSWPEQCPWGPSADMPCNGEEEGRNEGRNRGQGVRKEGLSWTTWKEQERASRKATPVVSKALTRPAPGRESPAWGLQKEGAFPDSGRQGKEQTFGGTRKQIL